MASLNKVILIGHLTADPELKQTPGGVNVTSFSIGITRPYIKKGETPQTDFLDIVAWRSTAEFIAKYFKKGNAICICGSIQTRSYTAQDGTKRYVTEIVADEASFIEKKSLSGAAEGVPAYASESGEAPKFEEVASDEDLPF